MSYSNAETGAKPADPYTAKNEEEPSTQEKIADLVAFIDKAKFCMMTTKTPNKEHLVSRCMALAGKENNNVDLIFHSNSESGKTDDLEAHPDVNLAFLTAYGEWASISGKAEVVSDRDAVRKHYSPELKAWMGDLGDGKHDGGPEDPRIVLIRIKSQTASYSVSRKNLISSAVEIAKGVITGEAPSVSKLRHISEQELQDARSG